MLHMIVLAENIVILFFRYHTDSLGAVLRVIFHKAVPNMAEGQRVVIDQGMLNLVKGRNLLRKF